VQSIVNDIAMPPLGYIIGGVDFSQLKVILAEARTVDGKEFKEVAILYGKFINTVINFLVVAFVVFMVVKGMNRLIRKREVVGAV
jgi:large conductance mechanosensitive channel